MSETIIPVGAVADLASVLRKIDADADAIRKDVIGERATEYQTAYSQALSYRSGSYSGTAPAYVKAWLDAKNAAGAEWTSQQATDDIIATGDAWMAAETSIRTYRLLHKELARSASDAAALLGVAASWAAFVVTVRTGLGI